MRTDTLVRVREGTAGRLKNPARSTCPRTSTLRISHFPDPRNRRYNRLHLDGRQLARERFHLLPRPATQLSREYCNDRAVAVLSHPAYGSRTIPAHGTERATRPTSTQVSTAAAARHSVAADNQCGT